jgi:hypothetical protein
VVPGIAVHEFVWRRAVHAILMARLSTIDRMTLSYVVTGGGRGIGRAIVARLPARGHAVVVVERDAESLSWAAGRVTVVAGDAGAEATAERAPIARRSWGVPSNSCSPPTVAASTEPPCPWTAAARPWPSILNLAEKQPITLGLGRLRG